MSRQYILERQALWARRRGIQLQGSQGDRRGAQVYTLSLNDNLFEPLGADAHAEYLAADGGEFSADPCKMQALHSSSALAVNFFHYWKRRGDLLPVVAALGLARSGLRRVSFEARLPIVAGEDQGRFPRAPSLDALKCDGYATGHFRTVAGLYVRELSPGLSESDTLKVTLIVMEALIGVSTGQLLADYRKQSNEPGVYQETDDFKRGYIEAMRGFRSLGEGEEAQAAERRYPAAHGPRQDAKRETGGGAILPLEYFVSPVDVVKSAHQPGDMSNAWRSQPVIATARAKASEGVSQPRVCLGRALSSAASISRGLRGWAF